MENLINYEAFRENTSYLLSSRHLQKKEVALSIGTTKVTFARWMSGFRTPDLEYTARLASYFGVTMEWLMGVDNPSSRSNLTDEQQRVVDLLQYASDEDKAVIDQILSKYERTDNRT